MKDIKDSAGLQPETLAIRGAELPTEELSHSEPMFLTSSFRYNSAEQAEARFSQREPGNIYSRFINPTVTVFQKRLALLEGGERCEAFASGMSAISSTLFTLLQAGDHVVSSRSIFGTTVRVFDNYLGKFGVETTYVNLPDMAAWEAAIQPNTKVLYLETPSNPLSEIGDLRALAKLAHDNDALLVVDNCFCTPILQRPLELGADLVIHSATKFIDGQGRCMGGAVVGSNELVEPIHRFLRTNGPSLSPFNAWVFVKGLETLSLRMHTLSAHALELATWLEQQPGFSRVYYAGLPSHPQHQLAASQQSAFGAVLAFEVEDSKGNAGRDEAWRFMDAMEWLTITSNLGDVKTTITHPASTSHGKLTVEAREAAGIHDNMIRVSVGLEAVVDLQAEMKRGLAALGH